MPSGNAPIAMLSSPIAPTPELRPTLAIVTTACVAPNMPKPTAETSDAANAGANADALARPHHRDQRHGGADDVGCARGGRRRAMTSAATAIPNPRAEASRPAPIGLASSRSAKTGTSGV